MGSALMHFNIWLNWNQNQSRFFSNHQQLLHAIALINDQAKYIPG
jgi:hypothetical protein